ncbi:unnamed protein product [Allacma fusca]|uniref:Uncharacterized protein n=1 Tax=Allacma fusca TaxID=39272 RepID=A0A8J2LU91_9HEXA|nr:unnamed protein product [Allacma fusca]
MRPQFFATLLTLCGALPFTKFPLYDGNLYEIASNADDQVLAVLQGSNPSRPKVTLESWKNLRNQKWLAVGLDPENTFLILPILQSWDWELFRGRSNLEDFYSMMPSLTIVLNEDKDTETVDIQTVDNRTFQQWTPLFFIDREFSLLRNVGSGGRAEMGLCNETDVTQQWNFKTLPLLSVSLAL